MKRLSFSHRAGGPVLLLFACLLLGLPLGAQPVGPGVESPPAPQPEMAPAEKPAPREPRPRPSPLNLEKRANRFLLEGRPFPLLWAEGLSEADQLDEYLAAGLNTLYLRVEKADPESLSALDPLAESAQADGLALLVALRPPDFGSPSKSGELERPLAVDSRDPAYREAVAAYVGQVVEHFKEAPRLVAWVVELASPSQLTYTDAGFQRFLGEQYGSLASLNNYWGSRFSLWEEVAQSLAAAADARKPGGFGRATVDLARYRRDAYQGLLALWEEQIRALDRGRFVFAGPPARGPSECRGLVSVPEGYEGTIPFLPPSAGENDLFTHNVLAVDIARQGNRFAAMPRLDLSLPSAGRYLRQWMTEAFLHGAAGVGFSDWKMLVSSGLNEEVKRSIRELTQEALFPREPVARLAVIYEPIIGEGQGAPANSFGFVEAFSEREPSSLIRALARGTKFGQVDYLGVEALQPGALSGYSTILAPACFYLPQQAQAALREFVSGGGVLLADLGAGCYQSDGTLLTLPPTLAATFGAGDIRQIRFKVYEAHLWRRPTLPGFPAVTVDLLDPAAVADIIDRVVSLPGAARFLGVPDFGVLRPPIGVNRVGNGFAFFVPARLYHDWGAGNPDFEDFHSRLIGVRGETQLLGPGRLFSPAEVARYREGAIALLAEDQFSDLGIYNPDGALYALPDGLQFVGNPPQFSSSRLLAEGRGLLLALPLPVRVIPASGQCLVRLAAYGPREIELEINGTGAVAARQGRGLRAVGGLPTLVTLQIRGGAYPVAPGSRHQVITAGRVSLLRGQAALAASREGTLVVGLNATAGRVVIRPL